MIKQEPKITFFTGKGGVGKSTLAAAYAQQLAKTGKEVLLVELGDRSFYQDFFSLKEISYKPTPWLPNAAIACWASKDCLKEYALYLLKLESLYRLFFENKVSKALIEIAPGLSELSILGKITSGNRQIGPPLLGPTKAVDHLVVDAFATGHMLALLDAPLGMKNAIRFGPMHEQSRTIAETFSNPEICNYFIVSLAEELPVGESIELHAELKKRTGIEAKMICNKMYPLAWQELATQNEGEERFLNSIKEKIKNQEYFFNQLEKQIDCRILSIPFIFNSNNQEVCAEIAKEFYEDQARHENLMNNKSIGAGPQRNQTSETSTPLPHKKILA